MSVDLTIRQGDTTPAFTATVLDASGNPVNLTGATVTFLMRQLSSSTPTVNAAMTVTNAATGQVQYNWSTTDTTTPGLYMAEIHVVLSGGGTYTFPNQGYLSIEIQESLTNPSQQLISVAMAKDILNIPSVDRSHDTKILRFLNSLRSPFEAITGPIIPTNYDEWYDGGQYWIMLRHPPSTGYGTTPICDLEFVETYIGPIEYQFAEVGNPVVGSIYTYEVDTFSRVVRRGPGGGIIPFPNMLQSVHIGYRAGQKTVPDNVTQAVELMLQTFYQKTQQAGPGWDNGDTDEQDADKPIIGYLLPQRVRELLAPMRRHPSIG